MRAALIFVFGLVCLGGFYFAYDQNRNLARGPLPQGPVEQQAHGQVGAAVLKTKGAEAFRLELRQDRWTLAAPEQGPADGQAVRALLDAADLPQPLAVVREADPEEFGFNRPFAELILLGRDYETVVRVVRIGHLDASRKGRYVTIVGEPTARLAALEQIAVLTPDLSALRDKAVLEAQPEEPDRVSVEGPQGRFSLVRGSDGWAIEVEGEGRGTLGPADPFALRDLLTGIFSVRIREFVPATPPDAGAVTLRLAYNGRTEWLRLWPGQEKNSLVFGRSSHQPGPFLVPTEFLGLAAGPAEAFADQRALACDPDRAARLVLTGETREGPLKLVVEKSPHGVWRVIEPDQNRSEAPKVDQARASALVLELVRMKNLGAVEAGFEKPALTIRLESGKGELLAGLEAGFSGDGRLLGREPDRDRFFELEQSIFKELPGPWALTNRK